MENKLIENWAKAQKAGAWLPCPRCGKLTMKEDLHTNAFSRRADIYVCDKCGMAEAIEDIPRESQNKMSLESWFIFSANKQRQIEKQTAEIIMICKGNHKLTDNTCPKQAIAAYISDRYALPIEYVEDSHVNSVIWGAFLDYINSLDNPALFVERVRDIYDSHNQPVAKKTAQIDLYQCICIAFRLVRVRDKFGDFTNGFNEENVKEVVKENNKN